MTRPEYIQHYTVIQEPDRQFYAGSDEKFGKHANFGRKLGLTHLPGIHHVTLAPGRRTSRPHAESHEDEFVYVIAGTPDVWIDGELHRLESGDGVAFPAGTGIAHTFINNTDCDVQLLVVGEYLPTTNKIYYPCHPESRKDRTDWWDDWPQRTLGAHDGLPNALRSQ